MAEQGARLTGKVTKFIDSKGFGFIKSDKLDVELFVHQSDIKSDGFRTLSVGSTVEFTVSVREDSDKLKAVDVTGPKGEPVRSNSGFGRGRESRDSSSCYRCGTPGHIARDCPDGSVGVDRGCFNCGELGHVARKCHLNEFGNGGGGGGVECHECHQLGHFARDCPDRNSGGGGGECYECQQPGHFARECPNRNGRGGGRSGGGKCYTCGELGHLARDCPQGDVNDGGSGGRSGDVRGCFNCGKTSHFARDCPN